MTVTVNSVNDPPVLKVVDLTVVSGDSLTFDLLAGTSDVDGDPITVFKPRRSRRTAP